MPVPKWGPGSIDGYDYHPYLREYEDAGGDLAEMRKGTEENAYTPTGNPPGRPPGSGGDKPPEPPSVPVNQNDPGWSPNERAIVDYLRANTSHTVDPGGITIRGRSYDFVLDKLTNALPADGKNPEPGADSRTMLNEARNSISNGGQAPCLIFDTRGTGMAQSEAQRGIRRLAGVYGQSGAFPGKLRYIILIGDGYYL